MRIGRFGVVALLALGAAVSMGGSCGGASTTGAESADTRTYECPMHCVPQGQTTEYTQQGPGQCPVCGMNLRPRADQAPAGGAH